ncbi:MAG TPA: thermonuclease family protein [Blastocatellia bacterium]|nr:thermonuclease family protein [Blastocatellia bacterium]
MKMLNYKEPVEPEAPFRDWKMGVDKRHVATYVGLALIGGFALGFLTARYVAAGKPLDGLSGPGGKPEGVAANKSGGDDAQNPRRAASPPALPADYRRVTRVLRADAIDVDTVGAVKMVGLEEKPQQPSYAAYSEQALAFTQALLLGKEVKLQLDPADAATGNRNEAGEILAYVYSREGTFANSELIKQGYAFVSSEPFGRAEEFRAQERDAMVANRGIWGSGGSTNSARAAAVSAGSSTADASGAKSASDKAGDKANDKNKRPVPLSPSEFESKLSPALSSPGEQFVFVSAGDKMYHKEGCEYLGKKKQAMPLSQAKSSGYVACGRCFASTVLKAQ